MHENVAFYAGLAIIVVGLIVWIVRPSAAPGKSEIEFLGFKFKLDAPALAVMVIGIALTVLSSNFHVEASPPFIRVVCVATDESECDKHDIFEPCPQDREFLAKLACGSASKFSYSTLKLRPTGKRCLYTLLEITCYPGT